MGCKQLFDSIDHDTYMNIWLPHSYATRDKWANLLPLRRGAWAAISIRRMKIVMLLGHAVLVVKDGYHVLMPCSIETKVKANGDQHSRRTDPKLA